MKRRLLIGLICLGIVLIISVSYLTLTGYFFRNPYLSCEDYDENYEYSDGINIEKAGSVTVTYVERGEEKTKTLYDKCYNGMFKFFRGDLREFYCRDDNAFGFKYIKCEGMCFEGSCIIDILENSELELKPLIEEYNNRDADRINLIFLLVDFPDESLAKEFVKKNLAFEDGKIITIFPASSYEKKGEMVYIPEQISLNIGTFFIEPFKSNKDKFNLWYIMVDLENDKAKYEEFVGNVLQDRDFYFPSLNLKHISPIIVGAYPIDKYKYFFRANAKTPYFWGTKDINKEDIKLGSFYDEVGLNSVGEIIKSSSDSYPGTTWAHELSHSLFGIGDEYEETELELGTNYLYPNCAQNISEAEEWWGNLIGQVDLEYYELINIYEEFYNEYKKEDNEVSGLNLNCKEKDLTIGYFKGGCYGDSNSNVIRPTENSLMRESSDCPILGLVNRQRAEQVLDLFSGE